MRCSRRECKTGIRSVSMDHELLVVLSDSAPIENNTNNTNSMDQKLPAILSHNVENEMMLDSEEMNVNLSKAEQRYTNRPTEGTKEDEAESLYLSYDWNLFPKLFCTAAKEYEPTHTCENFPKGCFWSPDGTCLLVPSEDFKIRVYELPKQFYERKCPSDWTSTKFLSALTVKEGGSIYDVCWFPFMSSWDPPTCCFLSTSRESPVHLWDAYTGELRATYRPYNQVDEIDAPISVQFIDCGRSVWCGFKNSLKIFNAERPGRQISTISFNNDFPNMRGLVSCIRENPIMPGLVAFGTYSKKIGLYKDKPICVFQVASGVTQIEFSSCGTKMFTSVRRSDEFLCWDLRNPGNVLCSYTGRQSDTNQRIHFAFMPTNDQVVSGGTDGSITAWDISMLSEHSEGNVQPQYKIKLSSDCINGVSLHKCLPIVATTTGQRLCGDENRNRDNAARLWWMHRV